MDTTLATAVRELAQSKANDGDSDVRRDRIKAKAAEKGKMYND